MRHFQKSRRVRFVGAITLVAVLAATVLTTIVVGASAANTKASHRTRTHAHRTTARPMIAKDHALGGGPVPPVTG